MASFTTLTTSDGNIITDHFTKGNDLKVNWTYTGTINDIFIDKIDSNQNKTALIDPAAGGGKTSAVITGKWVWLTSFGIWSKPRSWSPMFIKVSDGTESAYFKYSWPWMTHGGWAKGSYPNHRYPKSPKSFTYNVPTNMFSTGKLIVEFWKEFLPEVKMVDCKITFNDGEVFEFEDRDTHKNRQKIIMRSKTFTFGEAPPVPVANDLSFTYKLPANIENGTYILELYDKLGQVSKKQKTIVVGPQKFLYKKDFDTKIIKLSNGVEYTYPVDDNFDPYIFSTELTNEYNTISTIKHQETHKIKWKVTSKILKVKIDLYDNDGFVKNIANNIDAQIAYYDWYLNLYGSSRYDTGVFKMTGNHFIKIIDENDSTKHMSSDTFSIRSTKVRITHPYSIKNGTTIPYEWKTDLLDNFSLSLYHYSFNTRKFNLYTYNTNNKSFDGYIFQDLSYNINVNQKYDWNIPLDFVQPDEGVSFFKIEPINTCYLKYSRVKFIKPTINETIFKKGNKILDDVESFGHTINKLQNNNYILVWYQKISGQPPHTIKYKITDNAYNLIGTEKTLDLSNNNFVNNYLTSQLRNKIISFNNGYILLRPEPYKDNNVDKIKMYLYFYDQSGNLDTTSYPPNGKKQAFTDANPIHDINNQHNFQNWTNNHNFQIKNTNNGGFIVIKTVESGQTVFREFDSSANAIDDDVILFSDSQKNKYTVEFVNLKSNSYMFFYRLFNTSLTNNPYYAKKFFYNGTTRNTLPSSGDFELNITNSKFKVNKIPVLEKTIALNENYVLVPFEVFDTSTATEVVRGKILDVTNDNWNIISFDNPNTKLDDEILSKTENLDSIDGIFEYEFQKLNNEIIFKYVTNENNEKFQNIRFFRIASDYKSIFQIFNEFKFDFKSHDSTLSEGGTNSESENKLILTDNIQKFNLYVSSQNPGLHDLTFNTSEISSICIISSSPAFPYLINTSSARIDWSGNLSNTDTVDIKLVKNDVITHTLATDLSFTDLSYNWDINLIKDDLVLTETTPTIDTTYKIIIQSNTVFNETHNIYFTNIKNTYSLDNSIGNNGTLTLNTPVIESEDNDYIYYKKENNIFSPNLISIPDGGFLMSYCKIKIRKKKTINSSYDIEEYFTNGLYTDNSGTQIFVDKYNSNFQKVNTYTSPLRESLYTNTGIINLNNIPFNYNTDNTLIALKNGKFALIYTNKMNGKILCDILDHTSMESNIQNKELASMTTTLPPFQPTTPFVNDISKNDFKIDSNYYPFFTQSGSYIVSSYKYTFNTKKFAYNNGFGLCYTKFTTNSKKIYLAFYDENGDIIRADVEIPLVALIKHTMDPSYPLYVSNTSSMSIDEFINRIDLDISIMKNNNICIFVKDQKEMLFNRIFFKRIVYNYSSNIFISTNLFQIQYLLNDENSPWNNYMYTNTLDNGNIIFSYDNQFEPPTSPTRLTFTVFRIYDKDLNQIKVRSINSNQFRVNNSDSPVYPDDHSWTNLFKSTLFHFNRKIVPIKGGFVMLLTNVLSPMDNFIYIYDNNGEPILDEFIAFNNNNLFEQMFILPKNYGFILVYGGINTKLELEKYISVDVDINISNYPALLFCGQLFKIQWNFAGNVGTTGKLDLIYKSNSNVVDYDLSQNIVPNIVFGSGGSGSYDWIIPYNNFNNTPYKFRLTSNQFIATFSSLNVPEITSIQLPNWTSITYSDKAIYGKTFSINWNYTGNMNFEQQDISSLKLEVINTNGNNIITLAENLNHKIKNYDWYIPFDNSNLIGNCKIKISDLSGHSINTDISGSIFSFITPELKLPSITSTKINQGTNVDIKWDYSGNISDFKLELYKNSNLIQEFNSVSNGSLHELKKDDKVVAKWPNFYGKNVNPWYPGTVGEILYEKGIAYINYNSSSKAWVRLTNIYYAPNVNNNIGSSTYSSGSLKVNDINTLKENLQSLNLNSDIRAISLPNTKICSPHLLKVNDRVLAKWPPYHGKADNPWFVGTIESITNNNVSIQYDSGSTDLNVPISSIKYANYIEQSIGQENRRTNDIEIVKGYFNNLSPVVPVVLEETYSGNCNFNWNIPYTKDISGTSYTVKIYDISNNTTLIETPSFEIVPTKLSLSNIQSSYNQNESYTINWDYSGNIQNIKIDLLDNNDNIKYNIIDNSNVSLKTYNWIPKLSSNIHGTNNFKFKIYDKDENVKLTTPIDSSLFSIVKPSFNITKANIFTPNKIIFGTNYSINWNHNLTLPNINIDLMNENSFVENIVINRSVTNKPYVWNIPVARNYDFNSYNTPFHIRIRDINGIADDISSNTFEFINGDFKLLNIKDVNNNFVSDLSQNEDYTINWDYSGNIKYINLDLYKNNVLQENIVTNHNIDTKSYTWKINLSNTVAGNNFTVRITDFSGNVNTIDATPFSIIKPSFTIPQANILTVDKVLFGKIYDINWAHNLTIKSIKIELFDIDDVLKDTIKSLNINNKPFKWLPSFNYSSSDPIFSGFFNIDLTKNHKIKITDLSGNADSIESQPFEFIDSSFKELTIPSSVNQNRNSTINWDFDGNISYVKIDLFDSNDVFQQNIIDNSNVSVKSYSWTPDLSKNMFGTNKFKLRIYDISENSASYDSSLFSIIKPSLTVFTTSIQENNNRIIMSDNNVYDISWNFQLDITNINIFLMKNNNKVLINNNSIVSNRPVNNNPYSWTLPLTNQNVSDISGTDYYIRIEDNDDIAEPVDSPVFEIIAPKFTSLTIPSIVNQNQPVNINWDYSGNISSVKIDLIDFDDKQVFDTIIDNSNASIKIYNWTPELNKLMFGSFKLKITDISGFSSFICSS